MLTLKDRIKVGLAQYVIHLHFVSCSKYFFFKKFRKPRPKEMLQKVSATCRTKKWSCYPQLSERSRLKDVFSCKKLLRSMTVKINKSLERLDWLNCNEETAWNKMVWSGSRKNYCLAHSSVFRPDDKPEVTFLVIFFFSVIMKIIIKANR